MRSALVALAAATTFLAGVLELGGGGKPVPDPIETGEAGQLGTKLPSFSLGTIGRFEQVEPLVHNELIDSFGERDEVSTPIGFDLDAPGPVESDRSAPPTSDPLPSPTPSEAETSPSPSPSPSQSQSPSPTPSPTPSESASPAP